MAGTKGSTITPHNSDLVQRSNPLSITGDEYDIVCVELERSIALTKLAIDQIDHENDTDAKAITVLSLLSERLEKIDAIMSAHLGGSSSCDAQEPANG